MEDPGDKGGHQTLRGRRAGGPGDGPTTSSTSFPGPGAPSDRHPLLLGGVGLLHQFWRLAPFLAVAALLLLAGLGTASRLGYQQWGLGQAGRWLGGGGGGGGTRQAPTAAQAAAAPFDASSCAPLDRLPEECGGHYLIVNGSLTLREGIDGRNAWGNDLSPYWQARGMARLAGLAYTSTPLWNNTRQAQHYWHTPEAWLTYLDNHVPRHSCPDLPALSKTCRSCADWRNPHMCTGAWTSIVPTIQHESHVAFERWAADNKKTLPTFQPTDVVIQFRCENGMLGHSDYGPIAFSYYSTIAATAAVTVIRDPSHRGDAMCGGLFHGLLHFLNSRHTRGPSGSLLSRATRFILRRPAPAVQVVTGDLWEDWARMMYAPSFYKAASSMGLWAAVANTGVRHSVPLRMSAAHISSTPDLGPDWRWSSAATLFPHVAKDEVKRTELGSVLNWLEHN